MKSKKLLLLVSERRERIKITRKGKRSPDRMICEPCGQEVDWLSIRETAEVMNIDAEEVKQEIKNGRFDFRLTEEDKIVICPNSLFDN
ncbi:MAG: hypothetical protein R2681_03475 [Pyrinomonadaceae bacterium]